MFRLKDKLQIFLLGLTTGLLIGTLFFLFKLDDYVKRIDLSVLQNLNPVKESKSEDRPEETTTNKTENKKSGQEKKSKSENSETSEAKYVYSNQSDSIRGNEEIYNVLKEELISVKNLNVKTIGTPEVNQKDSLLAAMAGIKAENPDDFFMIEFRKTPLNSKGYKMTRQRILIYGYEEKKDLAVIRKEDEYFLRNNNTYYKIAYSAEFKPMEKVNPPFSIEKLN